MVLRKKSRKMKSSRENTALAVRRERSRERATLQGEKVRSVLVVQT
jgi:hypothetical protein